MNSVMKMGEVHQGKAASSVFVFLCEQLDADHSGLLLQTEVRCLSRGRVL